MIENLDGLELELRRVRDVRGVGFSRDGAGVTIHVVAAPATPQGTLRRRVDQRVRPYVLGDFEVEIHGGQRPAAERSRVCLSSVRLHPELNEIEIKLGFHDREGSARGDAGSAIGAAKATIRALRELGAAVPFTVDAGSAALREGSEHAAVVVLDGRGVEPKLYGVARGDSLEQAACRATLHALNRYLEGDGGLS